MRRRGFGGIIESAWVGVLLLMDGWMDGKGGATDWLAGITDSHARTPASLPRTRSEVRAYVGSGNTTLEEILPQQRAIPAPVSCQTDLCTTLPQCLTTFVRSRRVALLLLFPLSPSPSLSHTHPNQHLTNTRRPARARACGRRWRRRRSRRSCRSWRTSARRRAWR